MTSLAPPPSDAAWRRLDRPGYEHLRLEHAADGVRADGLVVVRTDDGWRRLRYAITLAPDGYVRTVELIDADAAETRCSYRRDASGRWRAGDRRRPDLDAADDVDLAITPFTNTPPLWRLALDVDAAGLVVTYPQLFEREGA